MRAASKHSLSLISPWAPATPAGVRLTALPPPPWGFPPGVRHRDAAGPHARAHVGSVAAGAARVRSAAVREGCDFTSMGRGAHAASVSLGTSLRNHQAACERWRGGHLSSCLSSRSRPGRLHQNQPVAPPNGPALPPRAPPCHCHRTHGHQSHPRGFSPVRPGDPHTVGAGCLSEPRRLVHPVTLTGSPQTPPK